MIDFSPEINIRQAMGCAVALFLAIVYAAISTLLGDNFFIIFIILLGLFVMWLIMEKVSIIMKKIKNPIKSKFVGNILSMKNLISPKFIALLLVGIFFFWWFQLRPAAIRKDCVKEATGYYANKKYRECLARHGMKPESLLVD